MMRIGIVNDLDLAAELLRRVVASVPTYEVAWIAKDGAEAVRMCAQDVPDLILMDLIMPVMDGAEATRIIMETTPCAILIVTASVGANASMVFEAMGYGALDAVNTPPLGLGMGVEGAQSLLNKIAMIGRLLGKGVKRTPVWKDGEGDVAKDFHVPVVAIGCSTGGPIALVTLLKRLPDNFPASIIIVQHVDNLFAEGLAAWLTEQSGKRVEIARTGTSLRKGQILLAGTKDHLVINRGYRLRYTNEPIDTPYCPSVDIFFMSLAAVWPKNRERAPLAAAVLLTGMGKDGAIGMRQLRTLGWYTIAESPETCVVYGMPKAAIDLGAAQDILPLPKIADALISYFNAI
jgi:two-component system response regulator WspF